jgi:hypothetical protein
LSQIQGISGGFCLKMKTLISGDEGYSDDGFIDVLKLIRI